MPLLKGVLITLGVEGVSGESGSQLGSVAGLRVRHSAVAEVRYAAKGESVSSSENAGQRAVESRLPAAALLGSSYENSSKMG